jgi:hypothetical protein
LPFAQAVTCVLLTTEMETAPPSTATARARAKERFFIGGTEFSSGRQVTAYVLGTFDPEGLRLLELKAPSVFFM